MSTYRASGPEELARTHWHKSAYSGNAGNCVEVAGLDGGHRAVRDSKDRSGPILIFTPAEWSAFTAGIRDGNFN